MSRTKKTSTQDTINIKSLPVQAHIGASKYVNNDWGTIAFIIPRNQLQLKFADPELRYNCIYFLFGFDQTTEKVYVGQAKKRNNGESVLARLREHDTSTTEKYCDTWEWAVVCTGKEDTWSLDDLNALEHAFYNEIPINQNLNGNNPNSGGANYDAYTDKIRQIKNYITSIGFNLFADNECMRLMDIVEDLLIEFEHLENMLEILEIGFENCTNGDHKCETSSIYVIIRYLEMIKTEYIEKLAETLSSV